MSTTLTIDDPNIQWRKGFIYGEHQFGNIPGRSINYLWYGVIACKCGYIERVEGWPFGGDMIEKWKEHYNFRKLLKKAIND